MIIFYLIAMTFLFSATILTIGCLGINLIKIFPHPEYMVLEKISFLGFIDRIENVIYVKWLLNDFICFEVIVYYISNSIKKQDTFYSSTYKFNKKDFLDKEDNVEEDFYDNEMNDKGNGKFFLKILLLLFGLSLIIVIGIYIYNYFNE